MDKREYLVRTFSRTKKKDYENYILTALWHKVDNLNLKPVSQQYVKRENSYALMDLYFPQIHVGIEVDEAFHKNIRSQDELRMDDILSAVKEDELEDFLILRIDATLPINQIHERINECVEIIKKRAEARPLYWLLYEEELESCRSQTHLSIHDKIAFQDIKDIANTVFGKNAKRYQRSYFRIGPQLWLWCPKLSIVKEGSRKSAAAGWLNVLADDWTYIDESHEDEEIVSKRKEAYKREVQSGEERAVFAKYKDNLGVHRYRFVDVFRIAGVSPEDSRFIRYERVKEEIEIVH
ncbi:hypothetical protein SAMN05216353_10462 [Halobacillus alkaliphilus]|uniref:Uncharacterized protein n=1 Tax=Halobacillus alkaliphilus TaxID=396056 RepID=A0A1I2KCD6_9BACI|nr:hypothetical protein [Halobacillus alkaliphilus]SFF64644.1 hypothetical protein SAMN05216353_10462 [Halobacillus alkaliphilus]